MRTMLKTILMLGLIFMAHQAAQAQVTIGPYDGADAEKHQAWIQDVLTSQGDTPTVFRFAPGTYHLRSAEGITLPDGATIYMEGATFLCAEALDKDGEAFLIKDVSNITIKGGEIVGRRDVWDPGVNIAGIRIVGDVENVHIESLTCRELSSNGIGVFGESNAKPIRNITLSYVTTINCCNVYADYLTDHKGPAPGSQREDQGGVAFYHVDGWVVDGCRFTGSKSDGTHFYASHNGRFTNNEVSHSTMGGYFLEECTYVLAAGNIINDNGSRGVTIERNSLFCTLTNNIIRHSGREGLWAPEIRHLLVSNNVFQENGRKDDTDRDCEIRLDNSDAYVTETGDVHIKDNIFYASGHQSAFILIDDGIEEVHTDGNTYTGTIPKRLERPAKEQ